MAPQGVLYAVDPYAPGRLGFSAHRIIARREVARERNGTVHWIRDTDLAAAAQLADGPPFDFIFSDSLNTFEGYRATWEAWSPLAGPWRNLRPAQQPFERHARPARRRQHALHQ